MKKQWLLVIACLGILVLAGCTGRSPIDRCAWDWYCPCDLVEGRAVRDCGPCGYPEYREGQVVQRAVAVNVEDCTPSE